MVVEKIEIRVIKKDIKNLHLYVKPPFGEVVVTAPRRLGEAGIESFALKHIEWIKRKQKEISAASCYVKYQTFNTGDDFVFWGRKYKIISENSKRFDIKIEGESALLFYPYDMPIEKLEGKVREWYRAQLKREIDILLPLWEEKTGLKCSSYQTKDMKTRWGTCNTKTKKLWFSLRLAKLNKEYLEYVILHELIHLKIPNHSAAFKAELGRYMPDYRRREKEMKNPSA